MVKNLNLIGNYSKSVRPSIHPSIWCRNVLVPKRLGAETSVNRQNAVAVVEKRVVHLIFWLSICWGSNIRIASFSL